MPSTGITSGKASSSETATSTHSQLVTFGKLHENSENHPKNFELEISKLTSLGEKYIHIWTHTNQIAVSFPKNTNNKHCSYDIFVPADHSALRAMPVAQSKGLLTKLKSIVKS